LSAPLERALVGEDSSQSLAARFLPFHISDTGYSNTVGKVSEDNHLDDFRGFVPADANAQSSPNIFLREEGLFSDSVILFRRKMKDTKAWRGFKKFLGGVKKVFTKVADVAGALPIPGVGVAGKAAKIGTQVAGTIAANVGHK
jgi:hypothetical protein